MHARLLDGIKLPKGARGVVFYLAAASIFVAFNSRFYLIKPFKSQTIQELYKQRIAKKLCQISNLAIVSIFTQPLLSLEVV